MLRAQAESLQRRAGTCREGFVQSFIKENAEDYSEVILCQEYSTLQKPPANIDLLRQAIGLEPQKPRCQGLRMKSPLLS